VDLAQRGAVGRLAEKRAPLWSHPAGTIRITSRIGTAAAVCLAASPTARSKAAAASTGSTDRSPTAIGAVDRAVGSGTAWSERAKVAAMAAVPTSNVASSARCTDAGRNGAASTRTGFGGPAPVSSTAVSAVAPKSMASRAASDCVNRVGTGPVCPSTGRPHQRLAAPVDNPSRKRGHDKG
jgi:hypothetical protein